MAERLKAAVLKTVKDASPSGVRIPASPLNYGKVPPSFLKVKKEDWAPLTK